MARVSANRQAEEAAEQGGAAEVVVMVVVGCAEATAECQSRRMCQYDSGAPHSARRLTRTDVHHKLCAWGPSAAIAPAPLFVQHGHSLNGFFMIIKSSVLGWCPAIPTPHHPPPRLRSAGF